ncbi:SDR family NAD(P)-dependent oxidoreductase, partial [Salmonella enterica subsp. enterica serovar Anatum]|nr:SDR family NAD(P)-dependent oxidoreductase [Salmonella enterica subsp. enterica serovar Anatum]
LCAQIAARHMIKQGEGGRIINITSVHEHTPLPQASAYTAAKQPAMPSMKYSRGVEYQIDEKNMTVSQMWEYGKERGFDWYSA